MSDPVRLPLSEIRAFNESRSPDGDGQTVERKAVGAAVSSVGTTANLGNEIGASESTRRVETCAPVNGIAATDREDDRRRVCPVPPAGSEPADSLQSKLQAAEAALTACQHELDDARARVFAIDRERAAIQNRYAAMEARASRTETTNHDLAAIQHERDEWTQANDTLQRTVNDQAQRLITAEATITDLRASLEQLYGQLARGEALRHALEQIAALNHVRNDEGRSPIPVALERWHQCIEIAKAALSQSPEAAEATIRPVITAD